MAEEEAKRLAEEEKRRAEEERRRVEEEKKRAEDEKRRLAIEEARRLEREEAKRRAEEERQRAEEEKRREEEKKRREEEKRRAEEEKRREEEKRKKAEESPMKQRSRRSLDRLAALRSLLTLSEDEDELPTEKEAVEKQKAEEQEAREQALEAARKRQQEQEEKQRQERETAALAMLDSDSDSEGPEEAKTGTASITSLLRASYVPIRMNHPAASSVYSSSAAPARSSIFEYPQYADYKKIDEEEPPTVTGEMNVLTVEEKKKIQDLKNDELTVYSYEVLRVVARGWTDGVEDAVPEGRGPAAERVPPVQRGLREAVRNDEEEVSHAAAVEAHAAEEEGGIVLICSMSCVLGCLFPHPRNGQCVSCRSKGGV